MKIPLIRNQPTFPRFEKTIIVFEPFLYLTNNFLDKLKGVEFSVQTEFRMDSDEVKIFKEYFCVTQRLIELFIENKEDGN